MAATKTVKAEKSYTMVAKTFPRKTNIYNDIVAEFLASGDKEVELHVQGVKRATLITQMTNAARGLGIRVRRGSDENTIWLQLKSPKTEDAQQAEEKPQEVTS